ncbi:hypothetical protein BpHYR1_012979 [Brachionus plicatilis]|uniref:RNA-directed DNA polymerase from mobile element jockey-like n=1 Tax=Brachionus plicatilis TaxID=10195 RepID=A0A3M7P9N0_BRAPC|nr:hypothetical protein BpHYR1_012979 [Brachionus plicatilis]
MGYSVFTSIEQRKSALEPAPTFLGIKLDPKLKYNSHFNEIVKKVSPKVNILRRIKGFKWRKSISLN